MSDLEIKRKKLIMRSMRRGTKEMDLILKNFSKLRLDFMTEEELEPVSYTHLTLPTICSV